MVMEYLTAILVLVTAIYAYLTYKLARSGAASVAAMEHQNWVASRPYVVIEPFVRPHTPFLYLRIKNNGRSSAHKLNLSIDKEFWQFGESKSADHALHNKSAFSNEVDAFHPGQELLYALGQGWKIFGAEANSTHCPATFSVSARYEHGGKEISETFPIDLSIYVGSEGARDPLVEELERIRKVLEKRPAF